MTQNETRHVGEEALREALRVRPIKDLPWDATEALVLQRDDAAIIWRWDSDRSGLTYDQQAIPDLAGFCDAAQGWVDLTALRSVLLASHPTTGQETVATPRDGGVREALKEARQWVEANTANVRGLSAEAAAPGEAMLRKIDAALSAPGSAGSGVVFMRDAQDALDAIEAQAAAGGAYDREMSPLLTWAQFDVLSAAIATPSPAQEPATPATTAETRGPADDEAERCIACDVPFTPGDRYLPDASGGNIHRACCGPGPGSFTHNGGPLPACAVLPEGSIWPDETPVPADREGGR